MKKVIFGRWMILMALFGFSVLKSQNWQLKCQHKYASSNSMGSNNRLYDFDSGNEQNGAMIDRYGTKIRFTTDGGQTWSNEFNTPNTSLVTYHGIKYIAPNTLLFAGKKKVYKSNGTQNFVLVTDTLNQLGDVYSIDNYQDFIIIGTNAGWIYYSNNGGNSWNAKRILYNAWEIRHARVYSSTFAIVGTSAGAYYYTTDAGSTWYAPLTTGATVNGNPIEPGERYITAKDENNWILTGRYNNKRYVFRTSDAGQTWTNITNNLPNISPSGKPEIQNVFATSNGKVYATISNGINLFSNDWGDTFVFDSIANTVNRDFKLINNKVYHCVEVVSYDSVRIYASEFISASKSEKFSVIFQFYPNPSHGQFMLETEKNLTLELLDITGKSLYQYQVPKGRSSFMVDLPQGLYWIKDVDTGFAQKLIIN